MNKQDKTAVELYVEKKNLQLDKFIDLRKNNFLIEIHELRMKKNISDSETLHLLIGQHMQMELKKLSDTDSQSAKSWNPCTLIWDNGKIIFSNETIENLQITQQVDTLNLNNNA